MTVCFAIGVLVEASFDKLIFHIFDPWPNITHHPIAVAILMKSNIFGMKSSEKTKPLKQYFVIEALDVRS